MGVSMRILGLNNLEPRLLNPEGSRLDLLCLYILKSPLQEDKRVKRR